MTTPAQSSVVPHPGSSPFAEWIRQRQATIKGIAIGSVTWPLALAAAWSWWPRANEAIVDRIAYAFQLSAAPAMVLLLMIAACLRLFDTAGAEDPSLGAESARFKLNQRVLTNSLEQLAIFALLLLALAPRLPVSHLHLLPIAVTLWCSGRVMFWIGYHIAPHWRAPGFDWTYYTTVLLAGWFIYTII